MHDMNRITRVGAPYSEARYDHANHICAECLEHSKKILPEWQVQAMMIESKPVIINSQCDVCERNNQSVVIIQPRRMAA
jgi:hypothetical protein